MLVVTISQIPGYRIEAVLGEVFGVGSQQQGRPNMGQAEMVYLAREQAVRMMVQQAQQRAANAVIGHSIDVFHSDRFGAGVTAIGTAVQVVLVGEGEQGATPQSIQDAKTPDEQLPPPVSGPMGQQPGQPQAYPSQQGYPSQSGPSYAQPGQPAQQGWGPQYPQGYGR